MKAINNIITNVSCKYGAPSGRVNIGTKPPNTRIYDCKVPMDSEGAYDKGGTYWGIGNTLRVAYTKDLSYVEFYRGPKRATTIKITVWDNGGETLDRYTVLINNEMYGMSETGCGFDQYCGNIIDDDVKAGKHLGKKLKEIPKGIMRKILNRIE